MNMSQADGELKVSQDYIWRPCFKIQSKKIQLDRGEKEHLISTPKPLILSST